MTPWKKNKILTRNDPRWQTYGSKKKPCLIPINDDLGLWYPVTNPSVLNVMVYKKYSRQLRQYPEFELVQDEIEEYKKACMEFDFWQAEDAQW